MNIYLISEDTIKSESYVNDNLDSSLLLPSIQSAQDMHLQPLIGTNLYKKLMELIKTNSINDESNKHYKQLLDEYVKPFLMYAVQMDIQIPLAFKMRNAGVIQTNNEYANNSYLNDVQSLKTYYEQKMNFYGIRMSGWLHANSNVIKEYNTRVDCSEMPSDSDAYNSGILLD